MTKILFRKILFFFIFFHFLVGLFGQMSLKINSANKPNYEFYLEDPDGVKPIDSTVIAGVKSLSYSYLWIFSDGSFEKKPSSRTIHTFDTPGNYTSHVYSVEIYDNGPPPAPYMEKSAYDFSESSSAKIGHTDNMVAEGNYIDLNWFENELCHKDGQRVGIISFHKSKDLLGHQLDGVIKLYYNGEIRKNGYVVDNMSPTLSHTKSLNFGAVTSEAHAKGTRIINGHTYRDSLEWDAEFLRKEKHLYVEFATEEILKDYVSEPNKAYTTPFLLVFESASPEARNHRTSRAINLGFGGSVIDAHYINGKIEGDHDPNTMTIKGLSEKADDGSYWMQGLISFSNDASGRSIVRKVKVDIDLPDTYESIEWDGADCSENLEEIQYDGNGHWNINHAAITSIDDTLRMAYHVGWLKYRMKSKPGIAFEDLKPVEACISFGEHKAQCTEQVLPIQPRNSDAKAELTTYLEIGNDNLASNSDFCASGNKKMCYGLVFVLGLFVFLGVVRKLMS